MKPLNSVARILTLGVVGLMAGGLGQLASAQTSVLPSPSPSASPLPVGEYYDVLALNLLHEFDTVEIATGTSARPKAQSQQAQNLANSITTDYTRIEQLVTQLTTAAGLTLYPALLNTTDVAAKQTLDSLSGTAFDQAFLANEKNTHLGALNSIGSAGGLAVNPLVRNLVNEALQTITKNYQLAGGVLPAPSPSTSPSSSPTPTPSVSVPILNH